MGGSPAPSRKPRAVHDPGKILLDLALATAMGGDCLADIVMLRAEPHVFGLVASDPTVSRLVDTLAAAGPQALAAIRRARAEVRQRVLAGPDAPHAGGQVIVDIDGVLVLAHSDKQDATRTWKKNYGHHPLVAFVDHGAAGGGEPVAALLRPGKAGSNTAADHIEVTRMALAQLPKRFRRGRRTLVRTDSAGGTHAFLDWLTARGRWHASDDALAVRVHPRRPRCTLDHVQFFGLEDGVERCAVLAVPVAKREAQGLHAHTEVRGEIPRLLQCPLPRGVGGGADDVQASRAVL